MSDEEKSVSESKESVPTSPEDPGARRHGNFINYYQFHPAEERARQLPRGVWRRPTHPDRKYIGLDVGCNAGNQMPLGVKPECVRCGTRETSLWHATDAGSLCNTCLEDERNVDGSATVKNEDDEKNGLGSKPSRKSTRITRYCKPRPNASLKTVPKGKGRRHIFKKQPIKAPSAVATPVTSNFVFYKGSYFQVGDIVSMEDTEGGIYYAQIRGLLTDQYCEKSAAVTWLLPTTASPTPEEGFSPETYIIGPEEDLPRKLECMEFVMHAPSDYYKLKNSPYPPPLTETGTGYIWTSLRNEVAATKK